MATTDAIALRGLSKSFGGAAAAVSDLTFSVGEGEVFGFMGHNGAGKTTTLRMLLGLLRPTSGSATVLGRDIARESIAIRRLAGYLPGDYSLPGEMTARRFLRYVGALFGMSGGALERRIGDLLSAFGLDGDADRKLGEFSTGMAQKVGLAQALLNEPRVLLLDEPTSGLDPIGRHEFLELIGRLAGEGATVLFSTHILGDIERACRRAAILHRGRLIACGDIAALKAARGVERMDDLYLDLVRRAPS